MVEDGTNFDRVAAEYDVTRGGVERARLPGRLVRASALHLPFPASSFDDVVAVHVLHLVRTSPRPSRRPGACCAAEAG